MMPLKLPKRVNQKIQRQSNGCWLWLGCKHKNGYGKLRYDKVYWYAHRFVYAVLRSELKPELELDHLCQHRSCVNPWHMQQITHVQNMLLQWARRKLLADAIPSMSPDPSPEQQPEQSSSPVVP